MTSRILPSGVWLNELGSTQRIAADGSIAVEQGAASYAASGALVSDVSSVSGSATHSIPAGTHSISSAMLAGDATLSGSAIRTPSHDASGILLSGSSIVSGSATHVASTPTFITSPCMNNTETLRLGEVASWRWMTGLWTASPIIAASGTTTTSLVDGSATINVPSAGDGAVMLRFADGGVYYEEGTAA